MSNVLTPRALLLTAVGVFVGALTLAQLPVISIGLPVSDRVRIWDSTTTATVGTGTNKHLYVRQTDGTNNAPTMDAAARAGFVKITEGTDTADVEAPTGDNLTPGSALGVAAVNFAFDGTNQDRIRTVVGTDNTTGTGLLGAGLQALYDTTPGPYTDGRYGSVQMTTSGFLYTAPGSGQTWPTTSDTELPAAAAMADAQANPTVPHVGANGKLWNGSTWDRAPGDVTNGAYVQLKGNSISAPAQVSESYDSASSKTTNTATSTTAAAVPASALAARRLVRLYNDDASIIVYVCLNNASCANSAGANKGIALPPGGQRDYPVGPTNVLYVVAASGTPNVITEELK